MIRQLNYNLFLIDVCLKSRSRTNSFPKNLPIKLGIYHPNVDKNLSIHPNLIRSAQLLDLISFRPSIRSKIATLGNAYRTADVWVFYNTYLTDAIYLFFAELGMFNRRNRIELGLEIFRSRYTFEFSFRNTSILLKPFREEELELIASYDSSDVLVGRIRLDVLPKRRRNVSLSVSAYFLS
jgi:hypothetical protein